MIFVTAQNAQGTSRSLKRAGEEFGFEVSNINTVLENQERISSSALRSALAEGDMPKAALLLGRPYLISGHVIYGRQLGRTLGFPTLNLAVANHLHERKPAMTGIFTVLVHGLGGTPLPGSCQLRG
jgi:riboflavin kinase / FMN adenylyltransferase